MILLVKINIKLEIKLIIVEIYYCKTKRNHINPDAYFKFKK